jgi:ADP-glucose pyrophosphorylase
MDVAKKNIAVRGVDDGAFLSEHLCAGIDGMWIHLRGRAGNQVRHLRENHTWKVSEAQRKVLLLQAMSREKSAQMLRVWQTR